jgi:hypothetical protein
MKLALSTHYSITQKYPRDWVEVDFTKELSVPLEIKIATGYKVAWCKFEIEHYCLCGD